MRQSHAKILVPLLLFLGIADCFQVRNPAQASSGYMKCMYYKNVPTTMFIRSVNNKIPLIQWTENLGGVYPLERCGIVSQRMQSQLENGNLRYLVPAYSGSKYVLCASSNPYSGWSSCPTNRILMDILNGDSSQTIVTMIGNFMESNVPRPWEHNAGIFHQEGNDEIVMVDLDAAIHNVNPTTEYDEPVEIPGE